MSKAKFEAARELIQARQYQEARALLATIDHPMATEWIAKIDALAPASKSGHRLFYVFAGLVLVLLIVGAVIFLQQRLGSSSATALPTVNSLALAATQVTASPLPSVTTTSSPASTNTVVPVPPRFALQASSTAPTNTPLPPTVAPSKTPTSTPQTLLSKWHNSTSTKAIDNTKTITAMLDAENAVQGWLTSETPTLIIRCRSSQLEVLVYVGMQVESDLDHRAKARMRLDKYPIKSLTLDESTSGDALFFEDPMGLLNELQKAQTMILEFTPFQSAAAEATFDLRGINEAVRPLHEECAW